MKHDGTSPMTTLGSLTLCRSLLKAGLVDRFRVVVFPVITGAPAAIGFTTDIPMSPSTWLPARRSTPESSYSSMSPLCSPDRPRRQPVPEAGAADLVQGPTTIDSRTGSASLRANSHCPTDPPIITARSPWSVSKRAIQSRRPGSIPSNPGGTSSTPAWPSL